MRGRRDLCGKRKIPEGFKPSGIGESRLFSGNRNIGDGYGGAAEDGEAGGNGELQVTGDAGDLLEKLKEVVGDGEAMDRAAQLAVLDKEACALKGEIAGHGVGAGVAAVHLGDVDAGSHLPEQLFLGGLAGL